MEGSGCGLIEVVFRNFPGGTEEKQVNLSQDIRYPDRYSNRGSPEYKSKLFPLYQSASFLKCELICHSSIFYLQGLLYYTDTLNCVGVHVEYHFIPPSC
jgi:hypothetical protein